MSEYVEQITVPPEARALTMLSRAGYADAFSARVPDPQAHTAEEWMRLTIEGAPPPLRRSLRSGWRMLGLKHGPLDSAGHILGWEIRQCDPDVVRVGAASRVGMPAELVLVRRDDSLLFCTFIRHENPVVRAVWAPIVAPHERVVQGLLGRAAKEKWAILDSNQGPRPYQRRALTD